MKKQMERTVYEAPVTERFQVELEGVFCASIVIKQGEVTITDQGIASTEEFNGESFENNSWTQSY